MALTIFTRHRLIAALSGSVALNASASDTEPRFTRGFVPVFRVSDLLDGGTTTALKEVVKHHHAWSLNNGATQNAHFLSRVIKASQTRCTISLDKLKVVTRQLKSASRSEAT
jgi:hypothetical protein